MAIGFVFNEKHSSEMFIKAIRTNPILVAEKKHEFVEIPNKAGSVLIRDPAPKDVIEVVQCWYERPSNISARAYGRGLDNWLTTTKWARLTFDDDYRYYREAIMTSSITLDDVRSSSGVFEITFRCRPSFLPLE